ncbi:ATP-binding protein [Rhizobium lentis]|uniref:AAA family ATPase n=1 Tax=Rhizobium lentis TaxID=1138194 RepID=A0ABS7IFY6_9HYPH|nr:winged helix-turn-helix domain-containing protein [Rhizobium lentis]MBX5088364.1 AAA family ATPase [Rhizobium lentis]
MASHHHEFGTITYIFGPFRFIPQRQLLLRDGLPVRIGGRAFDILTLLVRRAGEVVSKSELIAFCWPSTYVHDSNLKVNVAALRRILDERADAYIATVSNRGYRFVADIVQDQLDPGPPKTSAAQARALRHPPVVIGRDADISALSSNLSRARCLTIVGPGGMGKTTMALFLAHHVQATYTDGVAFVDMSTVGDPQYAAAAIAAGVGARQRSEDALAEIVSLLHERKMLLILDNCEHLLPTVSLISKRLLEALPELTMLATSREPLLIPCEELHRLSSLTVPAPTDGLTALEAMDFSAVRLFVARANGLTNFVLSDVDAPLVGAICRRLDGIPLAIELAASKTIAYGVPTLLAMLEQKFLLLSNGERTAPLRQQTMLATLDWSYRLLSDDEAALLRVISVFSGAFQFQDAVAVAEAIGFDSTQTTDGLERLTSKSLAHTEYHESSLTYRLLESTRAFAAERLRDSGQYHLVFSNYAWRIVSLFEAAASESEGRDKSDWMAEYSPRIDDARSVMDWAFGPGGDSMLGIRLTAATIPLWYELSSLKEMRTRVELALLAARKSGSPKELTMKLVAARASGLAFGQHLPLDTEAAWRECYQLGLETRSSKYEIMGLWGLCSYQLYTGRPIEALTGLDRLIALADAQGDTAAVDEAHRMMATAEIYIGEIATARQRLERLAARNQRLSDPARFARFQAERGVAVRCTLSLALWASGEPGRAIQVARAAVERAKVAGHMVSQWNALAIFAVPISFWSGDYRAAREFLSEAEEIGKMEDIGAWREVCHFFKSALGAKHGEQGAVADLNARLKDMMEARQVLRAPMYHAMVAEAFLESGALDDARALMHEAHILAVQQDAHWCIPEILRITGLLELRSGKAGPARELLGKAISKAADMGALTLQLRATLALATALAEEDRPGAAFDLLSAICPKFSKHETCLDFVKACDLLASLRPSLQDVAATA